MIRLILAAALFTSSAAAHELTPTYPELVPSYVTGVSMTRMHLWNRRNDVEYYEIEVFDEEFNGLPFASADKIIKVNYLEHKTFEVYIREADLIKVKYICTSSKQLKEDVLSTGVKSRICSKVK